MHPPTVSPIHAELEALSPTRRAIACTTYADMERIRSNATLDPETGCHLWQRSTDRDGYALSHLQGTTVQAHRAVVDWYEGPIEDGWQVHHDCHQPSCINPNHLWLVTPGDHCRIELLYRHGTADATGLSEN